MGGRRVDMAVVVIYPNVQGMGRAEARLGHLLGPIFLKMDFRNWDPETGERDHCSTEKAISVGRL